MGIPTLILFSALRIEGNPAPIVKTEVILALVLKTSLLEYFFIFFRHIYFHIFIDINFLNELGQSILKRDQHLHHVLQSFQ